MQNILWTKYQNYKNVFEKENVNILPQQWPYNCAIALQESMQPPFGPIYNLPQNELLNYKLILIEIFSKNSYNVQNHMQVHQIVFEEKNWTFHMCWLSWLHQNYCKKLLSFTVDFKTSWTTQSNKSIHQKTWKVFTILYI
jgi:hypothetical protein